ncbi:MAG: DNA polymerase III subunit epsilon [Gammaproteobacteria bacterium]|nr:DNA polymerase III subunit epsilon [Gammaproteobacteria bacterium]
MRQIILDTETTGLEITQGHRLIEIGCLELVGRRLTGRQFHKYLNPEREVDEGAVTKHGFTLAKLQREPKFADIAEEFLAFIEGAELVIHNAPFDLGILNAELLRLDGKAATLESRCSVLDTLNVARKLHPGQRNSLDALCKRYGVDNSKRELHGALLDARILADVYLAMTGGQSTLELGEALHQSKSSMYISRFKRPENVALIVIPADTKELAAHDTLLERIAKASGGQVVFHNVEGT